MDTERTSVRGHIAQKAWVAPPPPSLQSQGLAWAGKAPHAGPEPIAPLSQAGSGFSGKTPRSGVTTGPAALHGAAVWEKQARAPKEPGRSRTLSSAPIWGKACGGGRRSREDFRPPPGPRRGRRRVLRRGGRRTWAGAKACCSSCCSSLIFCFSFLNMARRGAGGVSARGAAGPGPHRLPEELAGASGRSSWGCWRRRRRVSSFWVPLAGLGPPIQPRRRRRRRPQRQQVNAPRAPARPTWSLPRACYGAPRRTM